MSGGGGHGKGRRVKHEEHEEHENHERWLVTYADMLTLLMVLFIVMFAMSQVDQKKYNALKNGLADGFGATSSFMKGSDSILEGDLKEASDPELDGTQIFAQLAPETQTAITQVVEKQQKQAALSAATTEADRLKEAQQKLSTALQKRGLADDVSSTIDERGLVVSLVSRHVVFQPNVAQLSERGQEVVDTLAPVLKELGNDLRVDGHTNQAAGPPKYFATDWDLSAARAVEVLRRLNEVNGIPGDRLSLAAYGHEKPLMDPSLPGSQDINKRVDIVVLPTVGAASKALLKEAAEGRGDAGAKSVSTTEHDTDEDDSTEHDTSEHDTSEHASTTDTTDTTDHTSESTDDEHGDEEASAGHSSEGEH